MRVPRRRHDSTGLVEGIDDRFLRTHELTVEGDLAFLIHIERRIRDDLTADTDPALLHQPLSRAPGSDPGMS